MSSTPSPSPSQSRPLPPTPNLNNLQRTPPPIPTTSTTSTSTATRTLPPPPTITTATTTTENTSTTPTTESTTDQQSHTNNTVNNNNNNSDNNNSNNEDHDDQPTLLQILKTTASSMKKAFPQCRHISIGDLMFGLIMVAQQHDSRRYYETELNRTYPKTNNKILSEKFSHKEKNGNEDHDSDSNEDNESEDEDDDDGAIHMWKPHKYINPEHVPLSLIEKALLMCHYSDLVYYPLSHWLINDDEDDNDDNHENDEDDYHRHHQLEWTYDDPTPSSTPISTPSTTPISPPSTKIFEQQLQATEETEAAEAQSNKISVGLDDGQERETNREENGENVKITAKKQRKIQIVMPRAYIEDTRVRPKCYMKHLLYHRSESKHFQQVYMCKLDLNLKCLVVSIRGTKNVFDVLTDLSCECSELQAHEFYRHDVNDARKEKNEKIDVEKAMNDADDDADKDNDDEAMNGDEEKMVQGLVHDGFVQSAKSIFKQMIPLIDALFLNRDKPLDKSLLDTVIASSSTSLSSSTSIGDLKKSSKRKKKDKKKKEDQSLKKSKVATATTSDDVHDTVMTSSNTYAVAESGVSVSADTLTVPPSTTTTITPATPTVTPSKHVHVHPHLVQEIERYRHKITSIELAGHSMGGGVASVLAILLREYFIKKRKEERSNRRRSQEQQQPKQSKQSSPRENHGNDSPMRDNSDVGAEDDSAPPTTSIDTTTTQQSSLTVFCPKIQVMTFGSSAVYDAKLANWMKSFVTSFIMGGDVVPRLSIGQCDVLRQEINNTNWRDRMQAVLSEHERVGYVATKADQWLTSWGLPGIFTPTSGSPVVQQSNIVVGASGGSASSGGGSTSDIGTTVPISNVPNVSTSEEDVTPITLLPPGDCYLIVPLRHNATRIDFKQVLFDAIDSRFGIGDSDTDDSESEAMDTTKMSVIEKLKNESKPKKKKRSYKSWISNSLGNVLRSTASTLIDETPSQPEAHTGNGSTEQNNRYPVRVITKRSFKGDKEGFILRPVDSAHFDRIILSQYMFDDHRLDNMFDAFSCVLTMEQRMIEQNQVCLGLSSIDEAQELYVNAKVPSARRSTS